MVSLSNRNLLKGIPEHLLFANQQWTCVVAYGSYLPTTWDNLITTIIRLWVITTERRRAVEGREGERGPGDHHTWSLSAHVNILRDDDVPTSKSSCYGKIPMWPFTICWHYPAHDLFVEGESRNSSASEIKCANYFVSSVVCVLIKCELVKVSSFAKFLIHQHLNWRGSQRVVSPRRLTCGDSTSSSRLSLFNDTFSDSAVDDF